MKNSVRWVASLAAAAALAACSGTGPQMGQVSVYLTDSPAPTVATAMVTISRVYLVRGTSRFTITDVPQMYDLLTLQPPVKVLLGNATIPAGDYEQLRLVVTSAHLTLEGGAGFDVKVPSGVQTGIKVNFAGPISLPLPAEVVVDFDVLQNFVFTGPPTSPTGVLFTPVLHGSVM